MLAFVDMETTGLDAQVEVPLEVGITLTSDVGEFIAAESWLVYEPSFDLTIEMAMSHEIVGPMHDKSGLWKDLTAGKQSFTRDDADQEMVAWLYYQQAPEGLGMTGNSIGSLDRPFALIHFPRLNEYLGYRNIDMSTVKELCKRVNPILFDRIKPIVENKEAATHRVLDDNNASISEYRAYLDNFLIVGD